MHKLIGFPRTFGGDCRYVKSFKEKSYSNLGTQGSHKIFSFPKLWEKRPSIQLKSERDFKIISLNFSKDIAVNTRADLSKTHCIVFLGLE